MVGNARLRIVVGADLGRTVAGGNHGFTLRSDFVEILLVFHVVDTRTQFLESMRLVFQLRTFVLTLYHDTGWNVRQTNGRISSVNALSART